MIRVVYAHPYPSRSRANQALLDAIRSLDGLRIASLYDLYPDFDVDPEREQEGLAAADLIVWMHPFYWYGVPGLMKHWFEKVLTEGWAIAGGTALHGKSCLWVTTTGGAAGTFSPYGVHEQTFDSFVAPVEQTARLCGMHWLPPFVVHGAAQLSDTDLARIGLDLRARLEEGQGAA